MKGTQWPLFMLHGFTAKLDLFETENQKINRYSAHKLFTQNACFFHSQGQVTLGQIIVSKFDLLQAQLHSKVTICVRFGESPLNSAKDTLYSI